MSHIFTPGCALLLYKPHLADKAQQYLNNLGYQVEISRICCRHDQKRTETTPAIVVCSGCARRFRREHELIEPTTLWQIMAADTALSLPDYQGAAMSLQDACPTKKRPEVPDAIRQLLQRMNIRLIEAEQNRAGAVCCGDSFHNQLSPTEVQEKMRQRAAAMPCDEVVVHCVSCIKSLANGAKKPRYLLDLVFNEPTIPGTVNTVAWHEELSEAIENSR